jgi:hypothetical protein
MNKIKLQCQTMKTISISNKSSIAGTYRFIFGFLVLNFTFLNVFSQLPDGTAVKQSFIDIIKINLSLEEMERLKTTHTEIDHILTIDVFTVLNKFGDAVIDPNLINSEIDLLNAEFYKIGLRFKMGTKYYVPEYIYDYSSSDNDIRELTVKHSSRDVINLYLVDTVYRQGAFYYGFTYFPDEPDKNFIFLRKDYANGKYLVTLMGHFLGLLSTSETLAGKEWVNENNCATTGDLICDTYADPGLLTHITDSCTYEAKKVDPNGEYYVPSVANYMSESLDNCKCIFTEHQLKRMSFYLKRSRSYLK